MKEEKVLMIISGSPLVTPPPVLFVAQQSSGVFSMVRPLQPFSFLPAVKLDNVRLISTKPSRIPRAWKRTLPHILPNNLLSHDYHIHAILAHLLQ